MSGRSLASTLLTLACLGGLVAHSESVPAETSSNIKVGDTTYEIVERIVLANAVVFHKPQNPKRQPCIVRRVTMVPHNNEKNCGIPAGRISHGTLGCEG